MGRQSRLKEIAKHSRLFLSANTAGVVGASGEQALDEKVFEFNVVNLNRDVLERVKIGDNVSIDVQSCPFKVFTAKGQVGEVRSEDEAVISQNRLLSGEVCNLRKVPQGLRIRLKVQP